MSLRDYEIARKIDREYDVGEDFYGVVMALLMRADTFNQAKIRAAWPDTCAELEERYNLPAGLRVGEKTLDGKMERREDGLYEDDKLVRAI
jgi:hypothetical protein